MKQRFEELYDSLLKELGVMRERYRHPRQQVEHCFLTCNRYYSILRYEVAFHTFANEEEEIFFFKHCKPLFVAEMEYYSLYYHALLFKEEVHDFVRLRQFWSREALRFPKFQAEQKDFYKYYKSGRTDKDRIYFTRATVNEFASYDLDASVATTHDPFVSTLLALERYDKFVQEQASLFV